MFVKSTKKLGLVLASLFSILAINIVMPAISIAQTTSQQAVCAGVNPGGTCTDGSAANTVVKTVINLLSWIVGIISVIMIIIAGLSFVTSGGDAEKAKKARSTITYALTGLVIVLLAQVIVNFVIKKVN
jgi:cytochrome bd-type quinol oxidase subunit 2